MKDLQIPKSFKIFDQEIKVVFDGEHFIYKDDTLAEALYRVNTIIIRPSSAAFPQTEKQLEQTFWHEFFHFVFYYSGGSYSGKKDYVHQEEDFVDLTANIVQQAINSFEY